MKKKKPKPKNEPILTQISCAFLQKKKKKPNNHKEKKGKKKKKTIKKKSQTKLLGKKIHHRILC